MPKYYGVARSSEYLAHYGVKGMKWGVRKAIERGSERALDRQWRKANRKLKKLTKLGVNKEKYKKRAIGYGAGAAALGGAALAGTSGISNMMLRGAVRRSQIGYKVGNLLGRIKGTTDEERALARLGGRITENAKEHAASSGKRALAVRDWGKQNSIGQRLTGGPDVFPTYNSKGQVVMTTPNPNANSILRKVTNDQYLRGAAALGAAGLGVAAARNAYRAKTADRNMIRAAEWKREMDRTFAGTKYGKKRRRSNA